MKHSRITILIGLSLFTLLNPFCAAQEQSAQYIQDSQSLFVQARNLWAPVELQFMGYDARPSDSQAAQTQIRQAYLTLQVATELANENSLVWQDQIPLLVSPAIDDPGRAGDALAAYSQLEPGNCHPVDLWLGYRLEKYNDRQSRETFLQDMVGSLQNYPSTMSDTYTQLGLFAMEKGDIELSRQYFNQAYSALPYNNEALAHLATLSAPVTNQDNTEADQETAILAQQQQKLHSDILAILQWRTRLYNNPNDLDALMQLIQLLEDFGGYELAQDYYQQAYRLINANPQPDPQQTQQLYLKQIVSSYSANQFNACKKLCDKVLQKEPDNLLANTMAIKLANRNASELVDSSKLDPLIEAMESKTASNQEDLKTLLEKATWLYALVIPTPQKALSFAQKFDAAAEQSPQSQALLAFALQLNQKPQEAEKLITPLNPSEPIVAMTWAKLHLANGQSELARKALYTIDHTLILNGLIAEKIKKLLDATTKDQQNSSSAEAPEAQNSPLEKRQQAVLELTQTMAMFTGEDLNLPFAPEKAVRCFLRLVKQNDRVHYGDPLLAQVYLANIGDTTLVLGPGNFINPHVLIYADISPTRSSSPGTNKLLDFDRIDQRKLSLISHRYLGQHRVLDSGQSNTVYESLNIGKVREFLEMHPQQNYQVRFYLCLDPIENGHGQFRNKISMIKPETLTIFRKGFVPTRRNMERQFEAATQGNPNERLRALHLLAGLLREAHLARTQRLDYSVRPVDTEAIVRLIQNQLNDENFRIRAWSAHAMRFLPKAQGRKLASRLTQSLNDSNWFVQFMAAQSLATFVNMDDYHRWASEQAEHELIQRQAQLQLGQAWSIIKLEPLQAQDQDTASENIVEIN